MRRFALVILLTALAAAAQSDPAVQSQPQAATIKPKIVIPAGTTVPLALTEPILARSAKAGESIYAETAFPVVVDNQMAIPVGSYVQGQIDTLTRPGLFSPHAQLQIHFTKIIFTTGYTVELTGLQNPNQEAPGASPASMAAAAPPPSAGDVIAAVATPYVEVSSRSDVLLDNGSQVEMILQVPLRLNAEKAAAAVRQSNAKPIARVKSATRCRPIPATLGTPDTVIPGTRGTPPTVIPGGPGMPDTVIPGTPGTPPTVIPGSPDTPAVPCPGPPFVASNPKPQSYRKSFQIASPLRISAIALAAGSYQVAWNGSGPLAAAEILQNGNTMARVPARVVLLSGESPADAVGTRPNADGSLVLQSLRFAGEKLALYFDQGTQ